MRFRILLALVLAAALIAVPIATGATKKSHAVNSTARMAVVSESGAPTRWAGEVAGKPGGRSAILLRTTLSGATATGKAIQFTRNGVILATTTNTVEAQPDGSTRFPGTFKITGGTGRYRDATGSGTFEGILPANSNVLVATLKGKIRY
jgi:hypothetical protein